MPMTKLRLTAATAGLLLVAALAQPGIAAAATDSADTSLPIDAVTQLEMHTTANCVLGRQQVLLHRQRQPVDT